MPWSLALDIDANADKPLYTQIVDVLVREIRSGRLAPGDRLPGTRSIARALGVHRNTVLTAFNELIAEARKNARAR